MRPSRNDQRGTCGVGSLGGLIVVGFDFLFGVEGFLAILLTFTALTASAASAGPSIQMTAAPSVETVFNWSKNRCSDDFIPDSPARALRRQDGSLIVIAAHYQNSILEGRSFDDLKPNCTDRSEGADPVISTIDFGCKG